MQNSDGVGFNKLISHISSHVFGILSIVSPYLEINPIVAENISKMFCNLFNSFLSLAIQTRNEYVLLLLKFARKLFHEFIIFMKSIFSVISLGRIKFSK